MRVSGCIVHEALFDVTDEKAIAAAFERLDQEDIAIDILVIWALCAGTTREVGER